MVKLSICIATYNRAQFIAETLDSVLAQLGPGMELLVVDGASPDNTAEVMAGYVQRYPELRYVRESVNSGFDADYDKAVNYARGDYCWLMADDDLLCPGALAMVFAELSDGPDLVVVNSAVYDKTLGTLLCRQLMPGLHNRTYSGAESEALFLDTAKYLSFIGAVVIRRAQWLARDGAPYHGSLFAHVGVIFQTPPLGRAKVIMQPLIKLRYGNSMWTPRGFDIWMFKWPRLIWSFEHFSAASRSKVSPEQPWLQSRKLGMYRALGAYSISEYRRLLRPESAWPRRAIPLLIALVPGVLANFLASLYCLLPSPMARMSMYDLVNCPNSNWATRLLAKVRHV